MIALELLLILICMAGAAFFSGMETGVISIHRIRLRHLVEEGSQAAKILQGFLEHTDKLLGTTLVGTNACVVISSVTAASIASTVSQNLGVSPAWGKLVSSMTLAALLLLFSEYLPKAWFQSKPLERCSLFARPLGVAAVILRPVSAFITWVTRWIVPGRKALTSHTQPFVTREDLKVITRELGQRGVLSPKERMMIHRVFELSSRTAREIMIPHDQIMHVRTDTPVKEILKKARDTGRTRLPVFDDGENTFVGIINVRHVLASLPHGADSVAGALMRAVQFIPETMPVDDILPRMRLLRKPMCLVADEKGDVAGLITTEDVLEEIVGKL